MPSQQTCSALLTHLHPTLSPDPWIFESIPNGSLPALDTTTLFALIQESEGITLIKKDTSAPSGTTGTAQRFAKITLQVYSDLEAVGLTAAVSQALTERNMCANVVAALNHDYIFVPFERGAEALECLQNLSASSAVAN